MGRWRRGYVVVHRSGVRVTEICSLVGISIDTIDYVPGIGNGLRM